MGPPGSTSIDTVTNRSIIAAVSSGSLDGSRDLKVNMLADAIPRLKQIQAEVIASASAKSGNRSHGQDTEAAAAAGFVVRRGTQFFKDSKPFYFIGGNVSPAGPRAAAAAASPVHRLMQRGPSKWRSMDRAYSLVPSS
jgi:hypothetical protein